MRFIIYCRKSTEQEERQQLSIESQLAELREYAAREGLEIVASLCEAQTARKPDRIKFNEMVAMIEKGEAEGILAWHPDRLARNSVDGGRVIHLLDTEQLKALRFPTFWFEPTPQGKFMLNIAFGQSKYYVDNLSENIKRGIRHKLRRGEWSWKAPLGYKNNAQKRNIEPHPEHASTIRKAFELYATGEYTLSGIKRFLMDAGLRTVNDNMVHVATIQKMLTNPIYYGAMRFKGELHPASFEPIVSKELFDKVQNVMADKAKPKRMRKHDFLFSGLMKCHFCGCAITAEIQKGYHYYHCTKKRGKCEQKKYVREEKILGKVKQIVEQVSLPDDWAERMLDQLNKEKMQEQSGHNVYVQHLEEENEKIDEQLSTLLDLRLDGAISTQEYVTKKNPLVAHKIELEEQVRDVEHNQNNWLEPMRDLIIRSREAKNLLSEEKHQELPPFLRSIGSNVVLKGADVQVQAQKGWRVLRQRHRFNDWWSWGESNPRPSDCEPDALTN